MLKESVIAIEVYERGSDYDPSKDSTVRAEASRLRRVLADYYDGLDAPSPLRIEVPKGSYVPIFVALVAASPTPVLVPEAITPPIPAQGRPKWVVVVLIMALVMFGAWGVKLWSSRALTANPEAVRLLVRPAMLLPPTSVAGYPRPAWAGNSRMRSGSFRRPPWLIHPTPQPGLDWHAAVMKRRGATGPA